MPPENAPVNVIAVLLVSVNLIVDVPAVTVIVDTTVHVLLEPVTVINPLQKSTEDPVDPENE